MFKIHIVMFILLLTSCSNVRGVNNIQHSNANISTFNHALATEYNDFSRIIFKDWHWQDAKYFKNKAILAEEGRNVPAENFITWHIQGAEQGNLAWAGARLNNVMVDPVKEKYPERLAHVQRLFDCWVQRAAKASKPDKIEECRMDFVLEMSSLENALMPLMEYSKNKAFEGVIYFPLNGDEVDAEGIQVIDKAINDAKGSNNYILRIDSYTDSPGTNEHNMELAKKRADIVARHLEDRGIKKSVIEKNAHGEKNPATDTYNAAYKPENRRVEISIESDK